MTLVLLHHFFVSYCMNWQIRCLHNGYPASKPTSGFPSCNMRANPTVNRTCAKKPRRPVTFTLSPLRDNTILAKEAI